MPGNPPSTLPRQAGGFHLVRELGRGGMGVVYEAQEIDSGRVIALKVLAAELSVSGEAFERFRREARLAAAISDVHCVFVYGAHQIEESPAIAMELVGGNTLQERITRGDSIPIETAVLWILDVIDGLEAAHRAGVIHRDVKPSNCFVGSDGRVKIGDFGLSRTLERDIQLTQSGQFLGSPLYASPEQIRGRTVDARSDQYSCAATLYAVLTGRAPFGGSNVGEVLARIVSEPPTRMRSIRPDIPSELERVVLRGMEREPDKRFRDLDAFRSALLPFSDSTAAAASIPRRMSAWVLDGALIFFASSSLATMFQSSSNAVAVDPERPWVTMPLQVQVALGSMPVAYFALTEGLFASSLGKWLAGVRIASVGSGAPLWVRAIPRAFLYECPYLLLLIPLQVLSTSSLEYALGAALSLVGVMVFRVCTMRKRNGWRGPYELWSGTRVIQAKVPFRRVRRVSAPPESHVSSSASFPEKLGEYRVLGLVGATPSGPLLHARDERLERSVWIQLRGNGGVAGESRRALNSAHRLRWLENLDSGDSLADVFESPGGCGILDWERAGEPMDWLTTERVLSALAEELSRLESDPDSPKAWSSNQVWLDRNWNVRLLDEPIPPVEQGLDAVGLLGATARALLVIGPGREFPADLPVHAEPLVRSLTDGHVTTQSIADVRTALARSQGGATNVERRTRTAQVAIGGGVLALLATFAMLTVLVLLEYIPLMLEMRGLMRELDAGRVALNLEEYTHTGAGPPSGLEIDEEGRRLRAIVVSYETTHGFGATIVSNLEPAEADQITAAQRLAPNPTHEEMEAARTQLREEHGPAIQAGIESRIPFDSQQTGVFVLAGANAAWMFFALFSTLIWPAGLSFRLLGMAIRRRNGRRGGRLFGMVRVLLIALPLTAGYFGAFFLIRSGSDLAGWLLFALVAAAQVAGIVLSILDPTRGPIDRLLRSRIVPR